MQLTQAQIDTALKAIDRMPVGGPTVQIHGSGRPNMELALTTCADPYQRSNHNVNTFTRRTNTLCGDGRIK